MAKLTIREHVKVFSTLMRDKKIVYVDDNAVRGAAASLEGCAELLIDADEKLEVPVMMTVKEIRHFVSYMRALDAVAATTRDATQRLTVCEMQATQLRLERDEMFARLKAHEAHCGEFKEIQKAAQARSEAGGDGAADRGGEEDSLARRIVRVASGRTRGATRRRTSGT